MSPVPHPPAPAPVGAPAPTTTVGIAVAPEGDILDHALVVLLERLGFPALLLDGPLHQPPAAVLVRTHASVVRLRSVPELAGIPLLGIGNAAQVAGVTAVEPTAPEFTRQLRVHLTSSPLSTASTNRVRVTPREREILRTYTLGSTLREVAGIHHVAESTVREHYRRVARRYGEAGRPVGNKAQLLRELMVDGWLSSAEILG